MIAFLLAIAIALVAWEITVGIRNGATSALGSPFVKARRDTRPMDYWLILGFNLVFLIAFAVIFFHELQS